MADANNDPPATGKDPTDRQESHTKLQNDARTVLSPVVDDLVASPITDVSGTNQLLRYQMKAAEFHELAMDRLHDAGELDLPESDMMLVRHAREIFWYSAMLARGDKGQRAREALQTDIPRLVETFNEIDAGIDAIQRDHDLDHVDAHPDDERWKKFTESTSGWFETPWLGVEVDGRYNGAKTKVELYPNLDHVGVGMYLQAEEDGNRVEIDIVANLSPDQAESLAAALLEQADSAREENDV